MALLSYRVRCSVEYILDYNVQFCRDRLVMYCVNQEASCQGNTDVVSYVEALLQ